MGKIGLDEITGAGRTADEGEAARRTEECEGAKIEEVAGGITE